MMYRSLLLAAVSATAVGATSAHAADVTTTTAATAPEMQEIIVTATALRQIADDVATPVTVLEGEDLIYRRQATLGETLASEPGISADTFGAGSARPVIRGQTAPRVKVLTDGADTQDASQVSPDHAVVTEPLLLRRIEVLRGPSALLYGGGAISGAVNLIDTKIPDVLPAGGIAATTEFRGGTSDGERAVVGGVTGAVGPIALRAEGVFRDADDYRIPGGHRVDGTFNETRTGTLGASIVGTDGYFGIAYTRHRSEYGVPGHNHDYEDCHPHGTGLHCGGHGHGHDDHDHDDDHHDHDAHEHDDVFIDLRSNRWDVRGEYRNPLPGIARISMRGGITDYRHAEIEGEHGHGHDDHDDDHGHDHDHDDDHDHEDGTVFTNKARDIRVEVEHAPIGGLRGVIGVQHSRSRFNSTGPEAFLPSTLTHQTGLFLFESLDAGPVRVELAARQEWQRIRVVDDRSARHNPFSISGAAIWEFTPGYSAALTLARSQRAPNQQELFARGVHLATNTFEIGSPDLGTESARTIDLTFRKISGPTRFTIGAYHNDYDGYIYANTLDRFEDFRLIRYEQADARFTGIEAWVRHEIVPDVGVAVFGDYVRARLTEGTNEALPRIPAGRLGGRVDARSGPMFGEVEYYRVFEQSRIAEFETVTPGYNMLNATLAYRVPLGTVGEGEIFLRGTNLLNETALNHVSFVKGAAPLRGRNVVLGLRTNF